MEEQLKEPQVVEAEIIESKPLNENINSSEEPASAPAKKKFPGWNDLFVALGIFAFSVIIGSLCWWFCWAEIWPMVSPHSILLSPTWCRCCR